MSIEQAINDLPDVYRCPNCDAECDGTKQLCPECNDAWKRASDYIGEVLTRDGEISLDTKTFADFAKRENERLVRKLAAAEKANRYALAVFRALNQYTFEDSDHGLLIAKAVEVLEGEVDEME